MPQLKLHRTIRKQTITKYYNNNSSYQGRESNTSKILRAEFTIQKFHLTGVHKVVFVGSKMSYSPIWRTFRRTQTTIRFITSTAWNYLSNMQFLLSLAVCVIDHWCSTPGWAYDPPATNPICIEEGLQGDTELCFFSSTTAVNLKNKNSVFEDIFKDTLTT